MTEWGNATHDELSHPVHVAIHNEGLFALHNLTCWFCNERPAMFMMSPWWVFYPCEECQAKFQGAWTPKKKKWWKR